jgi:dsDNA-specific endonuclease/ATPase MutS2
MEEPEPITLPVEDILDLHAFSPRDIPAAVEAYLEEAYSRGFASVRIIHGKGIGVQRECVRSILLSTPCVAHIADAPPESGGWGATVVHFVKR